MRTEIFLFALVPSLLWIVPTAESFQAGKFRRDPPICRISKLPSAASEQGGDSVRADGLLRRRGMLQVVASLGIVFFPNILAVSARADDNPAPNVPQSAVLSGTVVLPPDASLDPTATANSALYVTVRPDTPDNVPAAILSGTRGKAPPVMAARFPSPTFPFEFQIRSPQNLTPEGAAANTSDTTVSPQDISTLWWANDDLIVSARWDSDGVAATRSPEDLVGRAVWRRKTNEKVKVLLTGRGAFGKFVTGGKS
jgi:hypothetical protein